MKKTKDRPQTPAVRSLSPIGVINSGLRAVPAVKYALGVAAIAVLGAVVVASLGSPRAAVVIVGGMFVGMLLLFAFSRLTAAESPAIVSAGVFLLWAAIVFFCTFLFFVVTAFAVRWPEPVANFLFGEVTPPPVPDIVLFDTWNEQGVESNPTVAAQFKTDRAYFITRVANYHWAGNPRGNISLRDQNGKVYGPWQAIPSSGQNNKQNVNWECKPNTRIPAGTYTVIDSDVSTWSQNEKSGRRGFSLVTGRPID